MRNRFLLILVCALVMTGCVVGDIFESSDPGSTRFGAPGDIGLNVAADGAPGGAAAAALGVDWVRIEIVEGQPTHAALADFQAHGIRVLAVVDYSTLGNYPGYYECGPGQGFGAWRAGWVARVGEVASAYAGTVDAWEVWNEEDHPVAACGAPVEYNPGLPASVYGPMLRDAYDAIRARSAAPIIMGGTDSGQVAYVDAARVGGTLWADAVAIHPYGVVPDGTWCPNPGEDLNCAWGTFRGKLDEYGAATGLPIWITEFGVRTQDTTHQANYLEDGFRAADGSMAFYFCASDAMVPPFGLTFADGTPKPVAYERFQQIAASGAGGNASRLHGTVEIGGTGAPSIYVSAWGHGGDFHETYTDALGIYAFEGLDPSALYNLVVNASFTENGFVAVDSGHEFEVRNNVELVAGPDAWHGENFALSF
jgi:hypothetical protein